jgi:choline-glycine betaine transporter
VESDIWALASIILGVGGLVLSRLENVSDGVFLAYLVAAAIYMCIAVYLDMGEDTHRARRRCDKTPRRRAREKNDLQ